MSDKLKWRRGPDGDGAHKAVIGAVVLKAWPSDDPGFYSHGWTVAWPSGKVFWCYGKACSMAEAKRLAERNYKAIQEANGNE